MLQYDFFRKGLQITSFTDHFKFLIEKDWMESSELEKLKNFSFESDSAGIPDELCDQINGNNNKLNDDINGILGYDFNSNLINLRKSSI